MCVHVGMCKQVHVPVEARGCSESSVARVIDNCECLDVGTGNQTQHSKC